MPALAGWALTGTLAGAATGLLWGGLVRIFLVHHITWSVNSVCHFLGTRRFETDDQSTNVAWLSLLSFGESWHHNHHAFPRSAAHGLRALGAGARPSALVIKGLEKLGLARNVVRIAPERQQQRQTAARLQRAPAASASASACAPGGFALRSAGVIWRIDSSPFSTWSWISASFSWRRSSERSFWRLHALQPYVPPRRERQGTC